MTEQVEESLQGERIQAKVMGMMEEVRPTRQEEARLMRRQEGVRRMMMVVGMQQMMMMPEIRKKELMTTQRRMADYWMRILKKLRT